MPLLRVHGDHNAPPALSLILDRARGLREQAHRELVYRPLQFHKRRQLVIRTRNETLSVISMRVSNPNRSPFAING
jgi:hypothetical protein